VADEVLKSSSSPVTGFGRLARGTAAFAVASVVQRTIGFLLLPIYARVLEPTEYGQIGVITAVSAALGTVLGFGLETAVFRARVQFRDDPARSSAFINTVGGFALTVPLATALVLALALGPGVAEVFDIPVIALQVSLVGTALYASATVVPLALLRAQERLRDYLRLTATQVVINVALMVLLVVVLRLGVLGWMMAVAASSGVLLVRGLFVLGHRWTTDLDGRYLRYALAFGLPLVPHALSHWGLSLSDRAVLGALAAPAEVGAYYVAYQLALPISMIAVALSQGVQPMYAQASVDVAARQAAGAATTHQALVVAGLAGTVAALGPPIVLAALPGDYADAARFIPWIALGVGLFGMYLIPMNAVSVMAGQTKWVWVFTLLAAATNIGLNLVFVPRLGALAAAIDTAVAYAVLLVGVFVYMRRVVAEPLEYDWRRMGVGIGLILAGTASAMMLTPPDPVIALVLRSSIILAVAGLLVLTGVWPLPMGAIRSRAGRWARR
jgi:O-antigen/teichoic acid export membrane protein